PPGPWGEYVHFTACVRRGQRVGGGRRPRPRRAASRFPPFVEGPGPPFPPFVSAPPWPRTPGRSHPGVPSLPFPFGPPAGGAPAPRPPFPSPPWESGREAAVRAPP